MKKPKLHILPLAAPFLRKIKTGVRYYDRNQYTNFDGNSIEIRPFQQPPLNNKRSTDSILRKILGSLSPHNLKYLAKLEISIEASFLFNKSTLRKFALAIASHFKALKQLDIRFLSCFGLHGENLKHFLSCFGKRMKDLIKVSLHFVGELDVDDQYLKEIRFFILKGCKSLQSFEMIILSYYYQLYCEKNCYFEPKMDKWLESLTSYHEYTCSNSKTQITSKGATRLCSDITRYLKSLKSLAFVIPSLKDANYIKAKDICKMICSLPHLQNLNLSFNTNAGVDDEDMSKMSSWIRKRLEKLQSLSLFLHSEEITDGSLEKFVCPLISLVQQLKSFALHVGDTGCVTEDVVIKVVTSIASNMKKLETLILNFDLFDEIFAVDVASRLSRILQKNLVSLKTLNFQFDWGDRGKKSHSLVLPQQVQQFDLCLPDIVSSLMDRTWENLNQLSLTGVSLEREFVNGFSKFSSNLKNLKQFKLVSDYGIIDARVGDLALAISTNLQNLTSLEFVFCNCEDLTSNSLSLLGHNICTKLKKLVHFHLRFYEPGLLHRENLEFLADMIAKRLQGLESLTLFFFGGMKKIDMKEISGPICSLIRTYLKNLKKLFLKLVPDDGYSLDERKELNRQIRKQLCHIPMLYLT